LITVGLALCLAIAAFVPLAVSFAAEVDFLLHEQVTYTHEDAERYLSIYHDTWEKGPELWKNATLEREAAFDQELIAQGNFKSELINDLPIASDISQDEAICIAYAWLEQKYGLSEDELMHFFPKVRFWTYLRDDSIHLWDISFDVVDPDDYSVYGWYQVYMNSQDGVILQSNDVATAQG